MAPLTVATTSMPTASTESRPVRPCGSATSTIVRSRNGETSDTVDAARINPQTAASRARYGMNKRTTRRSDTGGPVGTSANGEEALAHQRLHQDEPARLVQLPRDVLRREAGFTPLSDVAYLVGNGGRELHRLVVEHQPREVVAD